MMNKVQQFVLTGFTMAITSIFLMTIGNHAFAIEYKNYTSEKYKIKFYYPSDWTVTEKTSRFDSGVDISIEPSYVLKGYFTVIFGDDDLVTDFGASNVEAAVY